MTDGLAFSILLVDDDEDDRMIIDEAFLQLDYAAEIKKFINSKMLFHYLEQIDPSLYPTLIVLDNTLAETDAVGVLSQLKQNPAYHGIRVVVYSTFLSPTRQKELLAMGVYACFEKGRSMKEIIGLAKELKRISKENPIEP
jgi:CheY-like chemotaxis protein